MDANISVECMDQIAKTTTSLKISLLFEPTSSAKCFKVFEMRNPSAVKIVTPNSLELKKLAKYIKESDTSFKREVTWKDGSFCFILGGSGSKLILLTSFNREFIAYLLTLLSVFDHVVVKVGSMGVLYGSRLNGSACNITHISASKVETIVSVTGAGDSLVGTLVAGISKYKGDLDHETMVKIIRAGVRAATLTLESPLAVSEKISPDLF